MVHTADEHDRALAITVALFDRVAIEGRLRTRVSLRAPHPPGGSVRLSTPGSVSGHPPNRGIVYRFAPPKVAIEGERSLRNPRASESRFAGRCVEQQYARHPGKKQSRMR